MQEGKGSPTEQRYSPICENCHRRPKMDRCDVCEDCWYDPPRSSRGLSESEIGEMAALHAKVAAPDPETGVHPHWNQAERDRVHELARKENPAIQFVPSTEEMARRFGHRSARVPQPKGER